MSQTYQIPAAPVSETPLAAHLAPMERKMHRGAQTPLAFEGKVAELDALLRGAGVFDLGYRTFLRATGKDRVRWLNGMITQTVKDMAPGQTGYTLILNPQGRIQGDGDVSFHEESLLLETDCFQSERLLTHLRRYIIMDDVKLEPLGASLTALGIVGPQSADILRNLAGEAPQDGRFLKAQLAGVDVTLVSGFGPLSPRFEVWVAPEHVLTVWQALIAAGALPCGAEAIEDLRVLEGVPQFDVDFSDKHLPQETNLARALNFTKGCYIGQEIVERIRSRATVHRSLRQFALEGGVPQPTPEGKIELRAGDAAVGELTSIASFALPQYSGTLALGMTRTEALERSGTEPIRCDGGTAIPLEAPPKLARL